MGQALQSLRKEAGLSQRDLAERVGTTQSVISQLEDAEYEGHSLTMLRRIASALGRRVVVSFELLPQETPRGDGPSDAAAAPAKAA
ncbi:MAG: helix-turn-helix transcriptional regulator [Armatimonadota bacterium]